MNEVSTQFMPFFLHIASFLKFGDKKQRILTFCDKKYRILTFRYKTQLYLTVLQQNNVEACSLWPSLPRSLAPFGSLWPSIALRICLQSSCLAQKALAQLVAALLRYMTFYRSAKGSLRTSKNNYTQGLRNYNNKKVRSKKQKTTTKKQPPVLG